jgi:hypothetical protein
MTTGGSCADLGDSIKRLASVLARLDDASSCVSMVSTGASALVASVAIFATAPIDSVAAVESAM